MTFQSLVRQPHSISMQLIADKQFLQLLAAFTKPYAALRDRRVKT